MTWDPDTWYHVAFVYDDIGGGNATYNLYRTAAGDTTADLVLSTTTSALVSHSSTADRVFNIANYYGASGTFMFNGPVDEVRFSSVARDDDDFAPTLAEAVPEPASLTLLAAGLLLVGRCRACRS